MRPLARLMAALLLLAGCGTRAKPLDPPPPPPPPFDATVAVTAETGGAVAGATVTIEGAVQTAGADGRLTLTGLLGPVLAVVSAPGFLDEPVVVAREDAGTELAVRLLAATGPGGARRAVMHFTGDAMLGRRYETPTRPDTFVVTTGDGGASARAIVGPVAPLFAAARLRSLNLETVVGTLPAADAVPHKKVVLQSPPEITAALEALRTSVAVRGNTHARDWLEEGILSTAAALDGATIPHLGAAIDAADAAVPLTATAAGLRVGLLSYMTINGDSENSHLPLDEDPAPPFLPPGCCDWAFELRTFGFQGQTITITPTAHRIGDAWQNHILPAEIGPASAGEKAALWAAATAVYPELLDLVARRGHGGANAFPPTPSADVAALRAAGADLVVIEIHGGIEYVPYRSRGIDKDARAAIDAGADLVVCHHPHVLHGFEWYKGKLIAYSVGNFLFDEDILETYASVVLRVIFEEKNLLEARVFPVLLDRYRPTAVGGARAKDIVQRLHARSAIDVETASISRVLRNVFVTPNPSAVHAGFVFERNSARVVTAGAVSQRTISITATADRATDLPPLGLTRSRGPAGVTLTGLLFGEDLFRYGNFEDDEADGEARGGAEWLQDAAFKRVEPVAGAPSGVYALRLRRSSADSQPVFSRGVSRVGLAAHRLFDDQGGGFVAPLDGLATWSVRFQARLDGDHVAPTSVRLEVFHFDDTDPVFPTVNELLRFVEVPYSIPMDGAWHEVIVDLPDAAFAPDAFGGEANEAFFELVLDAPDEGTTVLFADDVQFLEWRDAQFLPDAFLRVDAVRARDAGASVTATLERLGD